MTDFDLRTFRSKLPPWVILLIGLFALNAVTPAQSRARKAESPGEAGISQKVEHSQAEGRATDTVDCLPPSAEALTGLTGSPSRIPRVVVPGEKPTLSSPDGAVRGRAPPAKALA
ncbi:MAG: hypothetical protein CFE26_24580 [Verrucomicrobiales bacterium VVV1]|nr:MAG: hypothetical protein CFE26_24580 [Verrucomicrobiales bacterium VVV1]